MSDEGQRGDPGDLPETLPGSGVGGPLDATLPAFDAAIDGDLEVTREHVGRYELGGEVGRGGQSTVTIAFDRHLGRKIAFKQPVGATDEPRTLRRFLAEARVTAKLEHPNIVPVHEIGQRADGTYYCTQKLIGEGDREPRTLAAAIAGAGGLRERLRLLPHFVDVCHAVAYAHDQGVLHRDLKPDNVVLGRFGETVVLDWGLALSLQEAEATPPTIAGTPAYMSPEQAQGATLDERADVWSLGAILFELLTGRPPYDGPQPHAVLVSVMVDDPPSVQSVEPGAPPALAAIVDRALRKDRAQRYAGAEEIARDVVAFEEGRRVGVYDYSMLELARLFVSRHKAVSAVSAAALVLLIAASIGIWASWQRAQSYLGEARAHLATALVQKAQEAERRFEWDRAAAYYAAARVQRDSPVARWGARLSSHRSHRAVRALRAHHGRVHDVRFAPDGDTLASAGHDGTVRLWRVADGSTEAVLEGHRGEVQDVAFSADGARLVTAGGDGTARLWTPRDGNRGRVLFQIEETVEAVDVTADGAVVVAGCGDAVARVVDVASGAVRHRLRGHRGPVYSVAFSPDGAWIATGDWEGGVRIFDARTGALLRALEGHRDAVLDVRFSPDGQGLATASRDHTVRMWSVSTGVLDRVLEGHAQKVYAVAYSPDGSRLASGSTDGTLRLWHVETGHPLIGLSWGQRDEVRAVDFARDGRLAWSGSETVWMRDREAELALDHARGPIYNVSYRRDGRRLAHVFDDRFIVRDAESFEEVGHLDGLGTVRGMSRSSDDGRVALICHARDVCILDMEGPRLERRVAFESNLLAVAISEDGARVAAGGRDGAVRVLSARTGEVERVLTGHRDAVFSLAFAPGGRELVSGSYDQTARIWDLERGQTRAVLRGHEHGIRHVAFSADGTRLATASWDETARLWSMADGSLLRVFRGHDDYVFVADFSPDGDHLVTASWDGTLRVWMVDSGEEIARYVTDESRIYGLDHHPDGDQIVYGGYELHHVPLAELGAPAAELEAILDRTGLALEGVDLRRLD